MNPNAQVFTLSWSTGEPVKLGTETLKDQPSETSAILQSAQGALISS